MISEFLKFGYLGLLAMSIFLCYRIIDGSSKNGRSFRDTLIILCFFAMFSIIGGGVGYLWASKELEVVKAKESTASLIKQQIVAAREAHIKAMEPLQTALEGATSSLNNTVTNTIRQEHLTELDKINAIIQARETQFSEQVNALKGAFSQATN